jgi:hypothetical protein
MYNKNDSDSFILFDIEFSFSIDQEEFINKIEKYLLQTLWMELAAKDLLVFDCGFRETKGLLFCPLGWADVGIGLEGIDEYLFEDDFMQWVDLEYKVSVEEIEDTFGVNLETGEDFDFHPHVLYVYALKYGQDNRFISIKPNFNEDQYLKQAIDGNGEFAYHGIEIIVHPDKIKIYSLLNERNHHYDVIDYKIKNKIIDSLKYCKKNSESKVPEHILDLIKLHPNTPEDLKATIEFSDDFIPDNFE